MSQCETSAMLVPTKQCARVYLVLKLTRGGMGFVGGIFRVPFMGFSRELLSGNASCRFLPLFSQPAPKNKGVGGEQGF